MAVATASDDSARLPPPSSTPSSSQPSRAKLQRLQSTGERIHEILETALQRAESFHPDSLALLGRRSSHQMAPDERDNETTGIMSRGSSQSYQIIRMASSGDTARPRRPMYSTKKSKAEAPAPRDEPSGQPQDQGSESEVDAVTEPAPQWWKRTLAKFQSIELENTGSVARDHLALERTFLAWLRTSLSFASIGVAVTQLFRLNTSIADTNINGMDQKSLRHMGRPLGATFLGISILTLLLGYRRYFRSQEWILKGKFPASRGTIIAMAFVALALMLLSLVVVIVIQPSEPN